MKQGHATASVTQRGRFFCFVKTFAKTLKPRFAWHMAYHRDAEQWSMIQFRDGADEFYHSKHLMTCSKCRLSLTTKRIWPKFNADLDNGYQLTEARQKASNYSAQQCGSC